MCMPWLGHQVLALQQPAHHGLDRPIDVAIGRERELVVGERERHGHAASPGLRLATSNSARSPGSHCLVRVRYSSSLSSSLIGGWRLHGGGCAKRYFETGGANRRGGSFGVGAPSLYRLQPLMEETSHGTTNANPTRKAYDSQSSRPRGSRALCPNHKGLWYQGRGGPKNLGRGFALPANRPRMQ